MAPADLVSTPTAVARAARPHPPERPSERAVAGGGPPIERIDVSAYTIPTDRPESDGTIEWDRTTIVVVEPIAAGTRGLGYSYADATAAHLVADTLARHVVGRDAWDVAGTWSVLVGAVRNLGRPGIAATAISALDNALWDLKARLLGVSLVDLLGRARDAIPPYGSGGFCSYSDDELRDQLGGWAGEGFRFVKMKVGRDPASDPHRVDVARHVIGDGTELFVDANGAHDRVAALAAAARFAERGVTWFEEPVSSDDVDGLRLLRDRAPAGMAIAAGEYGWDQFHFRRLIEAGAVDVLQADATRCLGTTGFQMAAALCEAHNVPLSSHCAPALHVHLTCAARPAIHLEWFHDHVRIERLLFDGVTDPRDGLLAPDRTRPGVGLELRRADAEPYLTWRTE
ncbi:MAG TPA: enolase C-terminal domain-like protein [Candidatus Limnocylindrales bacterium]|nr:enolase C-terminal domain-like protein [Candidatus Limnocylindrales bacterium]